MSDNTYSDYSLEELQSEIAKNIQKQIELKKQLEYLDKEYEKLDEAIQVIKNLNKVKK